ncbi:hypothetical protein TNCV_335931 [Trichonephila clavipes]|nr:hypothetical protein TNCV_335931 [Trichonephila clavipes]
MTTLELNKTTELNYGTETLPEQTTNETLTETIPAGTAMDQTLPPSRPGTPQHSICLRKRQCVTLINYYTAALEPIKVRLRNLHKKKATDKDDPLLTEHIFNEHNQRISDYERLIDLTVSEFSSLGNCENPGCAVHHTPHTSPVKINIPELPPLAKNTSTKKNKTDFEFYSITPKHLRPIKVVIKGLPKNSKTTDIQQDLLDLGFTVERVSQLTGRITNEPLPVFLITLPRNIDNAKIFKVDKIANMTVTVEGYESKGIT